MVKAQSPIVAFNTSYISSNGAATYSNTPASGSGAFSSCISTTFTYTFNSGTSNLLKLVDIFTNSQNYYIANGSAIVKLRRVNNSGVTGKRSILSMESTLTTTVNCPSSNQITLRTPYQDVMENFLNTNYINQGTDNIFCNTGNSDGNNNNIERVDVIFSGGLKTSSPANAGFAVFDRGVNYNHDGFRIAAITSIDANGDPASYGALKICTKGNGSNSNGSWGHPTVANGNKKFAVYVLRKEEAETQLKVSSTVNQEVGGVFFSFSDLGIAANQTIYGYSVLASDGTANPASAQMLNINDAKVYPTNTTETYGGLDMMAINAVFETSTYVLSLQQPELNAKLVNGQTWINWNADNLETGSWVELERSDDGINFSFLYKASLNGAASVGSYYDQYNDEKKYYRLKIKSPGGQFYFSKIISVEAKTTTLHIYPTLLHSNDRITIEGLANGKYKAIFTTQVGRQYILDLLIANEKATIYQPLPNFLKGIIYLNFKNAAQQNIEGSKLLID